MAYSDTERAVVLVTRPFVLLRFHPPDYELSSDARHRALAHPRRHPRGQARRGLPGDRRAPGGPSRPGYGRVHVEVEVSNFYPALAHKIARWLYANTQSRIHVIVTHGFLRSLARLEFEESAVGRFRDTGEAYKAILPGDPEEETVGDTPWAAVAALGMAAAAGFFAAIVLFRRR